MEINMNDIGREIVSNNTNGFLYAPNCDNRSIFLKDLEKKFPIIPDSKKPAVLYLSKFAFPKAPIDREKTERFGVACLHSDYLSLSIAVRLLERTIDASIPSVDERLSSLIKSTGGIKAGNSATIGWLSDELKKTMKIYEEEGKKYLIGEKEFPLTELLVQVEHINYFATECKRLLGIQYFVTVLDHKWPISASATKAVNDLLASSVEETLAIKVATAEGDWKSFYKSSGMAIERIDDYQETDLGPYILK